MDIYLVRVRQKVDKSLFIERKTSTTADDYIAISHVWGTPETIAPTEVEGAGTKDWANASLKHDRSLLIQVSFNSVPEKRTSFLY